MQKRQLYFLADTGIEAEIWEINFIVRAHTHTVDLAVTHLNNALSFDNGTHASHRNRKRQKLAKRDQTRTNPPLSVCIGSADSMRIIVIYFSADPFSILNYEA